jgi:hypothetical protein
MKKIYSQEVNEVMKPQNIDAGSNDLYWPKLVRFGNASYEVLLLQARDDQQTCGRKHEIGFFICLFCLEHGTNIER